MAVDGIEIRTERSVGRLVLDRPQALNALNDSMRAEICAAMPRFSRDPMVYAVVISSATPRAFCAGGDLRELVASAERDVAAAEQSLADEYRMNWLLECFSKPTLSVIDGIVMGSGVGLSAYGTHQVAGPNYLFAMPETAVGLFPDVGVSYVLARLDDEVGTYLGLTGRTIRRADAYRLGLVTHCLEPGQFADVIAGLADADPIDPLLDRRHVDPGEGELDDVRRAVIARCFAGDAVEEIVEELAAAEGRARGELQSWIGQIRGDLAARAPLSLKVTLRHLRSVAALDLREALIEDYRLACRFLRDHDLFEGVRALLIDKDRRPRWQPETLAAVSCATVERYFASLGAGELVLPTRAEMQARRI